MAKRSAIWQVTFDREFLCDRNLCPAEKALVQALAGWADLHLRCNPTKEQLSEDAQLGTRQMHNHLQTLKEKGYIRWQTVRMMGKNRNIYELLSPCGIRMVKRGGVSVQFPHGSLQKNTYCSAALLPKPTSLLAPKESPC